MTGNPTLASWPSPIPPYLSRPRLDDIPEHGVVWMGARLHPDPRVFKYWLAIVTTRPTESGAKILHWIPHRPIGLAARHAENLIAAGGGLIVFVTGQRRLGAGAPPVDPHSRRWQGYEFALDWNRDPDPEWKGYK